MSKESLKGVELVSMAIKYISKLNDKDIYALLSGEKEFKAVEKAKKNKKVKNNNSEIISDINKCESRAKAKEYIEKSKFTVNRLKEIAKDAEIYIGSKLRKEEVIEKIVEGTVGAKIKIMILSNSK